MIKETLFINQTKELIQIVDQCLEQILPKISEPPIIIHEAMRYSIFAGGKRVRPILFLQTFGLIQNEQWQKQLPIACCLELAHTYSLIHDDLPSMDNDDLRRGLPTSHIKFGEATAILTGDALLTFAFEVLSQFTEPKHLPELLQCFTKALGTQGMIGGQIFDLAGENTKNPTLKDVQNIHDRKTGALIQASMLMGAICANATIEQKEIIKQIGQMLGRVFQIADDILDQSSTKEDLGKSTGKDENVNKTTYPRVMGLEESKKEALSLVDKIHTNLKPFGNQAKYLHHLADYFINRKN